LRYRNEYAYAMRVRAFWAPAVWAQAVLIDRMMVEAG